MIANQNNPTDPRLLAQRSLRDQAVTIAGGMLGVSTIALLAAGAALPLVTGSATALVSLGGNALASWLVEWAKPRLAQVGAIAPEITLNDLAYALDTQQHADQQVAADVALLIRETAAVTTVLEALSDQSEHQARLLQLLAEDFQQASFRNEQLHEATYQAVLAEGAQLQVMLAYSHAALAARLAGILEALNTNARGTLSGGVGSAIAMGRGAHSEVRNIHTGGGNYIEQLTILPPLPPKPAAFQVPYPHNQMFVGRSAEMAELARILTDEASVVLTPLIAGMGGIGKTQLAAEFVRAQQEQASFPGGIFWLNMEQRDSVETQMAACAGPGGLDLDSYNALSFEQRLEQVKAAWAQPEPRRLVVLDNLEDPAILKQWRPTLGQSRLLITSRRDDWSTQFRRMRLTTLDRLASRTLLLSARAADQDCAVDTLLANPATMAEADAICETLGDLPLAVAIAGAYLQISLNTSFSAYHERIATNPLADEQRASVLMRDVLAEAGLPTGRERGILATFAISYEQLQAHDHIDALALTMLHAAAYCAPALIPQEVLWQAGEVATEDVDVIERRDAAIQRLRAIGLIRMATSSPALASADPRGVSLVDMHRLVAAYVRSQCSDDASLMQLSIALIELASSDSLGSSALLVQHLRHVASALEGHLEPNWVKVRSDVLKEIGSIAYWQGSYTEARECYEQSLQLRRTLALSELIARSLNNLGLVYIALGQEDDLIQAEACFTECLTIARGIPFTAGMISAATQLGVIARDRTQFDQAIAHFQTSLNSDNEPEDQAVSWNNLASTYYYMGQYDSAQHYYAEAQRIFEQLSDSWGIALTNEGMAWVALHTGKIAKAAGLFLQCVRDSSRLDLNDSELRALALEGLCDVAYQEGRTIWSTRLLGAATAVRSDKLPVKILDRPAAAQRYAMLSEHLGSEDFNQIASDGALHLDDVINEALNDPQWSGFRP